MTRVLQPWVEGLTMMQQSVLLSAIRGPDGVRKRHPCKDLARWFRRCVLLSAFDGKVLGNPHAPGGGSFTGPCRIDGHIVGDLAEDWGDLDWCGPMVETVDAFMDSRDELPFHYYVHMMHAFEVLGHKHPDEKIRSFWLKTYERAVHALHVWPETEQQMDRRLGDDVAGWSERSDESAVCSD